MDFDELVKKLDEAKVRFVMPPEGLVNFYRSLADEAMSLAAGLRAENARLKAREEHFAKALSVADGGQYRADWGGAIERLIREREEAMARANHLPGLTATLDEVRWEKDLLGEQLAVVMKERDEARAESDGRRRALVGKAEEVAREWTRAERAEAQLAAYRAALEPTHGNIQRLGAELGLSTVEEVKDILRVISARIAGTTGGEAAGQTVAYPTPGKSGESMRRCPRCGIVKEFSNGYRHCQACDPGGETRLPLPAEETAEGKKP